MHLSKVFSKLYFHCMISYKYGKCFVDKEAVGDNVLCFGMVIVVLIIYLSLFLASLLSSVGGENVCDYKIPVIQLLYLRAM